MADGLTSLEDEIHRVYPNLKFQKCAVHKIRQILKNTRPKRQS